MSQPKRPVRRYRAVFFDLVGTLMSTASDDEAHNFFMDAIIEKYRITTEPPLLLREFNSRVRVSYDENLEQWASHKGEVKKTVKGILQEHGIEASEADQEWLYQEYLKKHQTYVRLLEGAKTVLEETKELGVHVGLIANLDTEYVNLQLKWLDLSCDIFDSITTAEEVGARKPSPRIFNAALEKAGAKAKEAIMVGDSVERDMGGAKALGMTTVLLDTRMVKDELAKADFVASDVPRLSKILIELVYGP